jgi:hypothetical protein
MKLKTVDATVRLTAWTASVGAKAVLQKAWVRISNIPLDKRVEENAFYVGSLVGVSLDLDISTLHKPEYVRVLVGCRDVERIPASAEGCLGDNFYDFFYEIDKVVVGGPPKDNAGATVSTNANVPSPKRPRMERSVTVTEESSENQVMGSQSESGRRQRACDTITEVNDESLAMDNDSEDDSAGGNELLIETMAKEHEARQLAGSPPNSWLVPCSLIHKEQLPDPRGTEAVASLLPPLSQNLPANIWPPLPSITDISDGSNSPLVGSPDYVVQSPEGSHEDNLVVPEADETRFSSRIFPSANEDVMRKAMQATKKRNLEGNIPIPSSSNSFAALSDSALMIRAHKMGVIIPDDNFSSFDVIRDLENARNDINAKNGFVKAPVSTLYIENNVGDSTPLSMDWISSSDNDEPFTVVKSRKGKCARKKPVVVVSRPVTRSQKKGEEVSDNKSAHVPGRVIRNKTKPARFK